MADIKLMPNLPDAKGFDLWQKILGGILGAIFITFAAGAGYAQLVGSKVDKADQAKVDEALGARVTDLESTKTETIVRLKNLEEGQRWELDTMFQQASRSGLSVQPPPTPAPVPSPFPSARPSP